MLQRYYSMLSRPVHAFGNWRHTYQRNLSLEAQNTTVRATREDGKEIFFILVSGVWQPEADVNHKLQALLDAGGTRAVGNCPTTPLTSFR